MDRALTLLLAVIAGLVVVLGVGALVLTLGGDDDPGELVFEELEPSEFPPVEHDPDAAVALREAWTRWRTATFVSSGTWTRTLDARPDEPLTGEAYTAQDPPRRFQIKLSAVVERTETEETYERLLGTELALVDGYVRGDNRLYDVADAGDGCFHAELIKPVINSPWGLWAEYCFDDATGALELARLRKPDGVDVERHTTIRAEVADADFG